MAGWRFACVLLLIAGRPGIFCGTIARTGQAMPARCSYKAGGKVDDEDANVVDAAIPSRWASHYLPHSDTSGIFLRGKPGSGPAAGRGVSAGATGPLSHGDLPGTVNSLRTWGCSRALVPTPDDQFAISGSCSCGVSLAQTRTMGEV